MCLVLNLSISGIVNLSISGNIVNLSISGNIVNLSISGNIVLQQQKTSLS